MEYLAVISKNTIVWYWDRKLKEWRKGKVVTVNRHHLLVKKRHGHGLLYIPIDDTVINSASPKPTEPPTSWQEYWDNRKVRVQNPKKWRLLKRLGFKK